MSQIGIMQPYFLPYIGYFQLINYVDEFVIYDNIQYTKKGWINRNRFLLNGRDEYFTIPLKKASDFINIKERVLSENSGSLLQKQVNRINNAYSNSPHFEEISPLIEDCFLNMEENLFTYILYSLTRILEILEISTRIIISSEIESKDEIEKGAERVKKICKLRKATSYINPIGGIDFYNKDDFLRENIQLSFLKTNNLQYNQQLNNFTPHLSILDVLFWNGKFKTRKLLKEFTIV